MQTYPIYCAGQFISSDELLDVVNPFTGEIAAQTYLAAASDLDKAIVSAALVREELRSMPAFRRFEILRYVGEQLMKEKYSLAQVLISESGKPLRYAVSEIERAAQTFLVAAEESKRLPKEYISLDWTPAGAGKEALIKYFPCGIVAGISPFNFPLNLVAHKVAPAIAAGCPIILKPASSTPLSALELARIINETELPKGAFSVLPMTRHTGEQLVTDERIALLSFTGSPEAGWKMKSIAGKKKVTLELGGNAGVIVTPGADAELAIKKCLVGAFAYSGQICIHAQRIFVHESIFEKFIAAFCAEAGKLVSGDPRDRTVDISVMIDEQNAKRVEGWVLEAVNSGAKILCGGKRDGSYYQPTVLTGTNVGMKVNCEEVFGPVVIVEKYGEFDDAIRMINDSKFGLQAGVFTNDLRETEKAFNEIECGGVIINDVPTFRMDHMPYGGIKESGSGREGVKYAILDMMEPRILVK